MADFLKGVRAGADRATFEAARFYRIQQAQLQLNGLQEERQDKFRILGETVWAMFVANQIVESQLLDKCNEIQSLEQKILDAQNQIQAFKQEKPPEPLRCTSCDTEIDNETVFCPKCGAPTQSRIPAVTGTSDQSTCSKCRQPIRVNAKFCTSCGNQIT